jgi:hypothetical protein
MDGYLHTIIATGLLFASFWIGKFFGRREGEMYVWDIIGNIFNAVKIEINESGDMIVTDMNGKEKIVK